MCNGLFHLSFSGNRDATDETNTTTNILDMFPHSSPLGIMGDAADLDDYLYPLKK